MILLLLTISIESSQRDLFIDMVVDIIIIRGLSSIISKLLYALSRCFTFIPITGVGLGVRFYCLPLSPFFVVLANIGAESANRSLSKLPMRGGLLLGDR